MLALSLEYYKMHNLIHGGHMASLKKIDLSERIITILEKQGINNKSYNILFSDKIHILCLG